MKHPLDNERRDSCTKKFLKVLNSCTVKSGPLLVAVSGGADSVALIHLLKTFSSHLPGCRLYILHFNHQLRGEESERDERFVRLLASHLQLECITGSAAVGEYAKSSKESLEMEARKWRYHFFVDVAKRLGASTIFMGHHANDQAELFFLRFFRGASSEGLKGMRILSRFPFPSANDLQIIRPLLYCSRKEIEDYLDLFGIPWVNDSTNESNEMLRNKIRHQIIPLLETEYPQGAIPALSKTMSLLSDEADYLAQAVYQIKEQGIPFEQWHVVLQRRAVADALIRLGIVPTLDAIEYLIFHATKTLACKTKQGKQVLVYRKGGCDRVILIENVKKEFDAHQQVFYVELNGDDGIIQLDGLRIEWRKFFYDGKLEIVDNRVSGREYFDFDKVGRQICFRHWRAGDRFQPIGLMYSKKLQDVFVNLKIPVCVRQELWLSEDEKGVVFWVQGVRIGDVCKVTERTRMVVQMDFFEHGPRRTDTV